MQKFSRAHFEQQEQGRNALCAELAAELGALLARKPQFHKGVYELVACLIRLGHDLTSYDESDDVQVWGPDYVRKTGHGIVITFRGQGDVEVEWSRE